MAKKGTGRLPFLLRLCRAIERNEKRKRRRWLDELSRLDEVKEQTLLEASRKAFIVGRILQETSPPTPPAWPFGFKPEHRKLAESRQEFTTFFNHFDQSLYMRAHDGELLDIAILKAQGGDDEALVRVIEWNSLLMFEPWVRDRVADVVCDDNEVLFKRIVKAFQTGRRFHSKAKMRAYKKLLEGILVTLEWLGAFDGTKEQRKALRQKLGDELEAFAERCEQESHRLAKAGRHKAAFERRKDAETAMSTAGLVDGDTSYYPALRYARVLSRRRKLSVKT